jgi:hypothetical protein
MVKPGLRPLSTIENKKLKYELLSNAHSRIPYAISRGFHIEAIAIIESVLADRLESAINASNPELRIKNTLGSVIRTSAELGVIKKDLADNLKIWHDARSKIIHEMVKLSEEESTWSERMKFARQIALEGVQLTKEVDKISKKLKRLGER